MLREDARENSLDQVPLAQLLAEAETVRAEEVVMRVPDGRSVSALVNATPIRNEDGEMPSFVAPLEDLERLRADFLATVGHELSTPPTSSSGAAAPLLSQGSARDPAESRQFHRIIAEQAERMRALLSDLLDATRLRTGTLPVSPELSDPTALVDEARSAFLAEGWSNSVTLDLKWDLPWVMADRRRVLRVLGNLLSNAARHSPPDSPVLVSAALEGGLVSITVADRGRGMEPKRLPHLFRGFSRTDANGGNSDGWQESTGSGLGLSICKGIVEAHGGRIRAESDGPGLGSRFTFTLPVAEGLAEVHGRSSRRTQGPGQRARILVVDDDPMTLRHARKVLAGAGYTPMVAGDAEEALGLLEAGQPRLAILDQVLPGSDGIELMDKMRRTIGTPVISLRPRRGGGHHPGLRGRGCELRRQALLLHRAGGPGAQRPAVAAGAVSRRTGRTLLPGRPLHRLRREAGEPGRGDGGAHSHRVRPALRAVCQRRAGANLRSPAGAGLGTAAPQGQTERTRLREAPAPQAVRRCLEPQVHLRRAPRRLPDGRAADAGACPGVR